MKKLVIFGLLALGALSVIMTPLVAVAADKPVMFLDVSWDSAQIQNRIAGFIVEHGYGYKTDYLFSESLPGMLGLERGDVHVYIDGWVDNTPEWWRKAQKKGTIYKAGVNYPEAPQGWYVPTYLIKGDPERGIEPLAPDLEYVEDLGKYWELFKDPEDPKKGRFYNAPPGWKISSINEEKMEALGLDKTFNLFSPGSGTALKTVAMSLYEKGEPVLFYYWEPTDLMGLYDMTRLRQKTPYSEELWTEDNKYNCDFPAQKVQKVLNAEFAKNNEELRIFFDRYFTTLELNNEFLSKRLTDDLDLDETAIWFLKAHPEVWKQWIPEERPEVVEKVEKALQD